MAQSINIDAILYFPIARFIKKSLAIPHFSVKDISKINPDKLKEYGFKGLIFDKDNTLTAPYQNKIYSTIQESFEKLKSTYKDNIVILSNSAGTRDDKNYEDAKKIEKELKIPVIHHARKKPGGINTIKKYFNCQPQELVMFGDRIFTDIVFGNRYGMLTIHTALLSEENDNKTAAKIRKYEIPLINQWRSEGKKAPYHNMYHKDICLERLI